MVGHIRELLPRQERGEIHCFVYVTAGDTAIICAVANDGSSLALDHSQILTRAAMAHKIGVTDPNCHHHRAYARKYPNGYKLIWHEGQWRMNDAILRAIYTGRVVRATHGTKEEIKAMDRVGIVSEPVYAVEGTVCLEKPPTPPSSPQKSTPSESPTKSKSSTSQKTCTSKPPSDRGPSGPTITQ